MGRLKGSGVGSATAVVELARGGRPRHAVPAHGDICPPAPSELRVENM
ncbi:MAG: hypothetical protein ABR529_11055 [Actinomycetota bacterium]